MASYRERLARWALYGALLFFCLDLGGSLYEHLVVDTAWLDNPALIQPGRGGLDRKRFWIPIHGVLTVTLPVALWASWGHRPARRMTLLALGLYAAMRVWTFLYFVPFALQIEEAGTLSAAQLAQARTWVLLSMLRLPLVVGAAVATWLAIRRREGRQLHSS